jgi:hypothetical protein
MQVFLLIFLFLVFSAKVYAAPIPENMAVKVIVSEAANQGLKGMICVAEVIRKRGSIKGFSGYRRHGWANEPKSIWDLAKRAWEQSKFTNYTKGADHFMSVHTSGIPSWLRYCVKTYEYKDHIFFKEIFHKGG